MSVHGRLGVAIVVVAVAGVLLALLARGRPHLRPTVRVFVRLCAAAAAVEAALGILLLVLGNRPTEAIHYFYGAATVIPIPAAELVARRSHTDEFWLLVAGTLATALFGLRAATTGGA